MSKLPPVPRRFQPLARAVSSYASRGRIRRTILALAIRVWENDSVQLASAMAFDLFLALIPLLALAGWVLSLVIQGDAEMLHGVSRWLELTPAAVAGLVNRHAERFLGGSLAPVALPGALWLGSGAFASVMSAFQRSIPAKERSWLKRRLLGMACVLGLLGAMSVGALVAVWVGAGPTAMYIYLPIDASVSGPDYVALVVSGITLTLLVAGFFRIGLSRDVPKRRIWPGTALTIGMGSIASYGLSIYARTLDSATVYYGSLAAVAIILFWLWICSMALLLGAELNSYLEEEGLSDAPPEERVVEP